MFTHFDCVAFYFRCICTTATNYWLKFFSAHFLFRSHASALARTAKRVHEQIKRKIKFLFAMVRNAAKHIANIWPKFNMIFRMRSQIKIAYIWPHRPCEWAEMVWLFLAAFIFEILTFNLRSLHLQCGQKLQCVCETSEKSPASNFIDFMSLAQPLLWIGRVCFAFGRCCYLPSTEATAHECWLKWKDNSVELLIILFGLLNPLGKSK